MGIDNAAKPVSHAGCYAREAGTRWSKDDGGLRGAAQRFACGCIGGIARLCERITGDGEKAGSGDGQRFCSQGLNLRQ